MPLRKFRSVEEMDENEPEINEPEKNEDFTIRQKSLITLMNNLIPPMCKRGVQKFRTMQEANEARLILEIERARQLKEKRLKL